MLNLFQHLIIKKPLSFGKGFFVNDNNINLHLYATSDVSEAADLRFLLLLGNFSFLQMTTLNNYLNKIEQSLPQLETKNPKVSKASVGWHLDHSLKVLNGVLGTLQDSSKHAKPKLTLVGRFCLLTKYIPRGKGKAPKVVLPPDQINLEDVSAQLELAKAKIMKLPQIPEKATFTHLYFGTLTKAQTFKFLEVHTRHHLKIVDDILK